MQRNAQNSLAEKPQSKYQTFKELFQKRSFFKKNDMQLY